MRLISGLIFVQLILLIGAVSFPNSTEYLAAVVQYKSYEAETPSINTNRNLAAYQDILGRVAPGTMDIIVFPEYGLNLNNPLRIPDKNETELLKDPCNNANYTESITKSISCAARNLNTYIVINIMEMLACPDVEMLENEDTRPCTNGTVIYNTNLVFDRNGSIITRYRKFNLFGDPVFKPKVARTVTFETDFGVTFGLITCFDIVFNEPAVKLVRELNVTDIVFPSDWYNELPFGISVPYQQMWAYSNNVNLLAAGLHHTEGSGSGIYVGTLGPMITSFKESEESTLLVARVPKKPYRVESVKDNTSYGSVEQIANVFLKQEDLRNYQTELLNLTGEIIFNRTICHNESKLCCNFDIEYAHVQTPNAPEVFGYSYRVAVYSGNRTFMGYGDGDVSVCAILACRDSTLDSCGTIFRNYTNFHHITFFLKLEISGKFADGPNDIYFPSTVNTNLSPLPVKNFDFEKSKSTITMKLKPTESYDQLLVFGILGRNYNSNSQMITSSAILVFAVSLISLWKQMTL